MLTLINQFVSCSTKRRRSASTEEIFPIKNVQFVRFYHHFFEKITLGQQVPPIRFLKEVNLRINGPITEQERIEYTYFKYLSVQLTCGALKRTLEELFVKDAA